jgi:hypothetical protein
MKTINALTDFLKIKPYLETINGLVFLNWQQTDDDENGFVVSQRSGAFTVEYNGQIYCIECVSEITVVKPYLKLSNYRKQRASEAFVVSTDPILTEDEIMSITTYILECPHYDTPLEGAEIQDIYFNSLLLTFDGSGFSEYFLSKIPPFLVRVCYEAPYVECLKHTNSEWILGWKSEAGEIKFDLYRGVLI